MNSMDENFMQVAIDEAKKAKGNGDLPLALLLFAKEILLVKENVKTERQEM